MKLAEALKERADLNIKLQEIANRLGCNNLVQEGEKPAEDPNELLKEYDGASKRLVELVTRINQTNAVITLNGQTITALISKKDVLKQKLKNYQDLVFTASNIASRVQRSEIKILPTVEVKELQKKCDSLAKELRELENSLQEANWTTELL